MSSSASHDGGAAAVSQRYFCHNCSSRVTISPSSGELLCPNCSSEFVEEEAELPPSNPNPNPNSFFSFESHNPTADLFPQILLSDIAGLLSGGPHAAAAAAASPFGHGEGYNPLQFFQNYLQSMMGDGGANISIVFDGTGGGGAPHFAGNLGDYFAGNLEQLIQQLAENDPNRYGTPPASKSAVDSLPDVKVSQDLKNKDDGEQCAVCKDDFEIGSEAKQMPCKHLYHKECLIPWLELHNSCPVCRFELPTDDQDYENRRREERGAEEGNGGGGAQRTGRSFRIQLPWPFRASGSQGEGSNAGTDGNRGGESGGEGGRGPETRQEDLD